MDLGKVSSTILMTSCARCLTCVGRDSPLALRANRGGGGGVGGGGGGPRGGHAEALEPLRVEEFFLEQFFLRDVGREHQPRVTPVEHQRAGDDLHMGDR